MGKKLIHLSMKAKNTKLLSILSERRRPPFVHSMCILRTHMSNFCVYAFYTKTRNFCVYLVYAEGFPSHTPCVYSTYSTHMRNFGVYAFYFNLCYLFCFLLSIHNRPSVPTYTFYTQEAFLRILRISRRPACVRMLSINLRNFVILAR